MVFTILDKLGYIVFKKNDPKVNKILENTVSIYVYFQKLENMIKKWDNFENSRKNIILELDLKIAEKNDELKKRMEKCKELIELQEQNYKLKVEQEFYKISIEELKKKKMEIEGELAILYLKEQKNIRKKNEKEFDFQDEI